MRLENIANVIQDMCDCSYSIKQIKNMIISARNLLITEYLETM